MRGVKQSERLNLAMPLDLDEFCNLRGDVTFRVRQSPEGFGDATAAVAGYADFREANIVKPFGNHFIAREAL